MTHSQISRLLITKSEVIYFLKYRIGDQ